LRNRLDFDRDFEKLFLKVWFSELIQAGKQINSKLVCFALPDWDTQSHFFTWLDPDYPDPGFQSPRFESSLTCGTIFLHLFFYAKIYFIQMGVGFNNSVFKL
jgi:hypothetical protein